MRSENVDGERTCRFAQAELLTESVVCDTVANIAVGALEAGMVARMVCTRHFGRVICRLRLVLHTAALAVRPRLVALHSAPTGHQPGRPATAQDEALNRKEIKVFKFNSYLGLYYEIPLKVNDLWA